MSFYNVAKERKKERLIHTFLRPQLKDAGIFFPDLLFFTPSGLVTASPLVRLIAVFGEALLEVPFDAALKALNVDFMR